MIKRGQLQLSFGMIFSIIIIAVTLGVVFYVIRHFFVLQNCTDISLFYKDLEDRVNKAWSSTIAREVFEGKLPSGVESVCFGNLTLSSGSEFSDEHELLKDRNSRSDRNVFIYPPASGCEENLAQYRLKNAEFSEFFCVNVNNGKATVKIAKTSFDPLVRVCSGSEEQCGPDSLTGGSTGSGGSSGDSSGSSSGGGTVATTNRNACFRAQNSDLCDGLEIAYGPTYQESCCTEHEACC